MDEPDATGKPPLPVCAPLQERLKIRLGVDILPELGRRLGAGQTDLEAWLADELAPFGEEPAGLIRQAAVAWLTSMEARGELHDGQIDQARGLLGLEG